MGGQVTSKTAGITPDQRAVLERLAPHLDRSAYLAGGVAIAVTLHHRTSLDLDLFIPGDFDSERLAEQLIPAASHVKIVGRDDGTLYAEVDDVPVIILRYRYPLLEPPRLESGLPIPMASLEDLACMKVAAIPGRGAAKDFWDLAALLEHGVAGGDLGRLLELYERKFVNDDRGHVVRSLAYFGDADAAPLPHGLDETHWRQIKRDLLARVRAL